MVPKTIRMPGLLWNECVAHLQACSMSRDESMQSMLVRWIEAGLKREQQEFESDSEE